MWRLSWQTGTDRGSEQGLSGWDGFLITHRVRRLCQFGLGVLTCSVKKLGPGNPSAALYPESGVCGRGVPSGSCACVGQFLPAPRFGCRHEDAGPHSGFLQRNSIYRCCLKAAGLPNHSSALFLSEERQGGWWGEQRTPL